MPYSGPSDASLPDNVKALPEVRKRQWISVWNSTFAACKSDGGTTPDCEAQAFRRANGVALETATIAGMEILSTGKWFGKGCGTQGCSFTDVELDMIVEAMNAEPNFRVPVKLGHSETQPLLGDLPAAGWLQNFRRVADKVVVDVADVPLQLANLARQGAWRNRSVELRPMQLGGKDWPNVVTGVALLGSQIPAVNNLNDVAALYKAAELEEDAEAEKVVIFALDDLERILEDFDGIVARAEQHYRGRAGAPNVRALARMFRQGLQTHQRRSYQVDDVKIRELLKLQADADEDAVLAAVKELQAKPPANDEKTVKLQEENVTLSGRVLKLEQTLTERDASVEVEKAIRERRMLPAQRDEALKFALANLEGFKAFVASQPEVGPKMGESGSAGSTEREFAQYEPSEQDLQIAFSMGNTREDVIVQNMRRANVEPPAELLMKVREQHSKA